MYDLAIIGAGVVGCALAYELSSRDLSLVLIEKENDVAMGASRANTAIIHAGFDPAPETLMGQLNVEGMRRCYDLCEELDVEHRKTGSLVVAFDQEQQRTLDVLYRQGIVNGCQGLEIIDGAEARRREPNLLRKLSLLCGHRKPVCQSLEIAWPWPRSPFGMVWFSCPILRWLAWNGAATIIRLPPPH